MKKIILAIALLVAPAAADAQQRRPCAPREIVVGNLASKYGEARRSVGLSQAGVVEVYVSEETGTWTIIVTTPEGMSCLIIAGEAWVDMPSSPKGDPA